MYHPFERESTSSIEESIFCYEPYNALDRFKNMVFKIEIRQNIKLTNHSKSTKILSIWILSYCNRIIPSPRLRWSKVT